jgi:hypothetical protein
LLALTVAKPDNTTLVTANTFYGHAFNLANLPATGNYRLFIDPQYGAAVNPTVTVVPSIGAVAELDGASLNVNTATSPGTYGYFTFTASAGENIGIGISNLAKANASSSYAYVILTLYRPDGTTWTSLNCYISNGGCDLNLGIPATGIYSVLARSPSPIDERNVTMTFTATASRDLLLAATPGTPTSVNLSRRGQNARVTFSGTAGATVSLQVAGISTIPAGRMLLLTVVKPDSTSLANRTTSTPYTFNLTNLPATGTYKLHVDPQYGVTAGLTVTAQ